MQLFPSVLSHIITNAYSWVQLPPGVTGCDLLAAPATSPGEVGETNASHAHPSAPGTMLQGNTQRSFPSLSPAPASGMELGRERTATDGKWDDHDKTPLSSQLCNNHCQNFPNKIKQIPLSSGSLPIWYPFNVAF